MGFIMVKDRCRLARHTVFIIYPAGPDRLVCSVRNRRDGRIILPDNWFCTIWTFHGNNLFGRRRSCVTVSGRKQRFRPLNQDLCLTKSMVPSRRMAFKRIVHFCGLTDNRAIRGVAGGMSTKTPPLSRTHNARKNSASSLSNVPGWH